MCVIEAAVVSCWVGYSFKITAASLTLTTAVSHVTPRSILLYVCCIEAAVAVVTFIQSMCRHELFLRNTKTEYHVLELLFSARGPATFLNFFVMA